MINRLPDLLPDAGATCADPATQTAGLLDRWINGASPAEALAEVERAAAQPTLAEGVAACLALQDVPLNTIQDPEARAFAKAVHFGRPTPMRTGGGPSSAAGGDAVSRFLAGETVDDIYVALRSDALAVEQQIRKALATCREERDAALTFLEEARRERDAYRDQAAEARDERDATIQAEQSNHQALANAIAAGDDLRLALLACGGALPSPAYTLPDVIRAACDRLRVQAELLERYRAERMTAAPVRVLEQPGASSLTTASRPGEPSTLGLLAEALADAGVTAPDGSPRAIVKAAAGAIRDGHAGTRNWREQVERVASALGCHPTALDTVAPALKAEVEALRTVRTRLEAEVDRLDTERDQLEAEVARLSGGSVANTLARLIAEAREVREAVGLPDGTHAAVVAAIRMQQEIADQLPSRGEVLGRLARCPDLAGSARTLLAALRETDGDIGRTLHPRADLGDAMEDAAARIRAYANARREDRAALDAWAERVRAVETAPDHQAAVAEWRQQVQVLVGELGGPTADFPSDPTMACALARDAAASRVGRLEAEVRRLQSALERCPAECERLRAGTVTYPSTIHRDDTGPSHRAYVDAFADLERVLQATPSGAEAVAAAKGRVGLLQRAAERLRSLTAPESDGPRGGQPQPAPGAAPSLPAGLTAAEVPARSVVRDERTMTQVAHVRSDRSYTWLRDFGHEAGILGTFDRVGGDEDRWTVLARDVPDAEEPTTLGTDLNLRTVRITGAELERLRGPVVLPAPGHTDLMVAPEAVGDLPDTAPTVPAASRAPSDEVYARWADAPAGSLLRDRDGDVWHLRSDRRRNLVWWQSEVDLDDNYCSADDSHAFAPLTLVVTGAPDLLTEEYLCAAILDAIRAFASGERSEAEVDRVIKIEDARKKSWCKSRARGGRRR